VLLLTLGVAFDGSNPPSFFVVLLVVFFLVVLSFLMPLMVLLNLPWCCYFPLVPFLVNRIPPFAIVLLMVFT
jgi:hypothetical protein